MKYAALVPVKSLNEVKSRLATHLTQAQRAALVLDMLRHVLYVLRESNVLERVSVVSPDRFVLEQARVWGAQPLLEEQAGHNPALAAAASKEIRRGVGALLTISADLPLLQKDDIRCLVAQSRRYDVVVAPSREGTGTNALLARPPLVVPYVFGPDSLQRYLAEAQQRHLRACRHTSTGLALDIDTIDDLELLRQGKTANIVETSSLC